MAGLSPHLLATVVTVYGIAGACTALLQARQILRRGTSCDVSARFFAIYASGYALWLLYGVSVGSAPLILVDAVGLVCGLVTLAITLQARGSLRRPRTWLSCPGGRSPRAAAKPTGGLEPPTPSLRVMLGASVGFGRV